GPGIAASVIEALRRSYILSSDVLSSDIGSGDIEGRDVESGDWERALDDDLGRGGSELDRSASSPVGTIGTKAAFSARWRR
ncbi:MAG: hypothetical protein ACRDZP_03125, partial [Acidimicrobiales bacterium]